MTDDPLSPAQRQHLLFLQTKITEALEAKYIKGQHEHGGDLWLKGGLLHMAIEEVLDLAVYLYTLQDQLTQLLARYEAPLRFN